MTLGLNYQKDQEMKGLKNRDINLNVIKHTKKESNVKMLHGLCLVLAGNFITSCSKQKEEQIN